MSFARGFALFLNLGFGPLRQGISAFRFASGFCPRRGDGGATISDGLERPGRFWAKLVNIRISRVLLTRSCFSMMLRSTSAHLVIFQFTGSSFLHGRNFTNSVFFLRRSWCSLPLVVWRWALVDSFVWWRHALACFVLCSCLAV